VQALAESFQTTLISYKKAELAKVLESHDLVVAVMAVGIVVRSLCSHLKDKWTDTPVVAVDSSITCAVPVVGGHHGANELALALSKGLGLYPAITTATDSQGVPCLEAVATEIGAKIVNRESTKAINLAFLRDNVPILRLKGPKIVVVDNDVAVLKEKGLIVGLGARKGVETKEVLEAIDAALASISRKREHIGVMATAWLKIDENGIKEAAKILDRNVLYLPKEVLNSQSPATPSRANDLGLSGVAEPAVLALATNLILPKKAYGRVTVAIGE
jgi:cobalt-precorrin 5A hydrolase